MVIVVLPSLQSGGTEWQTFYLVQALARRLPICLWVYDREHIHPEMDRRLREIDGLTIIVGGGVAELLAVARLRPRAIVSYAINYYLPEIALKLLTGAPLFTERRNLYHWTKTQHRRRTQERIRNLLTATVICNSESVAGRVRDLEPETEQKIKVIYNAAPPISIVADDSRPAIVTVSNIKRGKGVETVLEVFKAAREEQIGEAFDFAIFGRLDDPAVFQGIDEALLRAVYRGPATQEKIFGSAAAILHLSESEGFPNAVLEALSAGAIPILSDIPVHRELFSDCAVFVRDAAQTLAAVRSLVRTWEIDRPSFEKRVEACKSLAQRFSLAARVDQYEDLLCARRR